MLDSLKGDIFIQCEGHRLSKVLRGLGGGQKNVLLSILLQCSNPPDGRDKDGLDRDRSLVLLGCDWIESAADKHPAVRFALVLF